MQKYTFENGKSTFYKILREKVDQYFKEKKIHPTGNWRLYIKSGLQILTALVMYIVLVFFTPPVIISIVLCILLGINLALIGFNVMHEGGHQTYSRHPWLNTVAAYFLNVLGGVTYYWKIKHNINHHTFTNVEGMDSDIDVKPFMRLHRGQPLYWYHRLQHIYGPVLYSLSYIAWIFYEDFDKYFSKRVAAFMERKPLPLREQLIFWITKLVYISLYIVIPIIVLGWLSWLIGFLVITLVCGLTTSLVFQLAHVVEGTEFHAMDANDKPKQDWAVHQVCSTSNFGTRSRLLHWFLGGLNFQIEHHLFPKVSHMHYPALSKIVRETCREYGIAYNEYKTMAHAVISHLSLLHKLGTQP